MDHVLYFSIQSLCWLISHSLVCFISAITRNESVSLRSASGLLAAKAEPEPHVGLFSSWREKCQRLLLSWLSQLSFKLVILLIIHRLGFEDSFRQNSMLFSLFTHFCTSKEKLMFLIDYLRERGQVCTETPHVLCWLDKENSRISCCTEIKSSTF